MYDGYTYPFDGGNISILVTNLPNGIYDLFIYSHAGADDANSVVNVSCANTDYGTRGTSIWGNGWASNEWEEGQQYLAFRKVLVVDGQAVQITLSPLRNPPQCLMESRSRSTPKIAMVTACRTGGN